MISDKLIEKHKNTLINNSYLVVGLVGVLIVFLLTTNLYSQSSSGLGTYGASFLQISTSARQVAMGNAATGLANDVSLLRYNIGGLGFVQKTQLGIHFHKWIEDTQQGEFGFVMPTDFGVVFGADIVYFNEGEITEFDASFKPTGAMVSSNDIAITIGAGFFKNFFGIRMSFGGAAKIVRQTLADKSTTALGMDLGLLGQKGNFSFGATVQNFSITKLKFIQREDPLPETYRAGVGYRSKIASKLKVNTDLDIAWLVDQKIRTYYGLEFIISDVFALRGGYKFHNFEANRWGAGFGFLIPMRWMGDAKAHLDYAYSPLDAFESSAHRFSLVLEFRSLDEELQGDLSAERKKMNELTGELQKQLEAAEKARLSAEEAEKKTLELQKLMEDRYALVKQIAEGSAGKIELHTPTATSDSLWMTMRINFDFDRANIRPDEFETMKKVGEILNAYPGTKVQISGHTCFIGTDEYNIRLSHHRVDSVMSYLHKKENVDFERFYYPVGYGKLRPIASNATRQGRELNRRVDFIVYTSQNEPPVPEGTAIKAIEMLDNKTVKIICNGRVNNYEDTFISNPDRIVIDFPGIFLLPTNTTYSLNTDIFIRVRIGYHPEEKFSRIVFDLRSVVQYKIAAKNNLIYIRID